MLNRKIRLPSYLAKPSLLLAAGSLVLNGCANPYVRFAPPDPARTYAAVSLPYALEYSNTVMTAYREKVIEMGDAERQWSNGLITLGGVVVGLAAAKAHSSATGGAAILGGLGYTLGVFNNDKRRPLIYLAGMKALQCANDAVAPLNLSEESLSDLKTRREALTTDIQSTGRLIGVVQENSLLVAQHVLKPETALQSASDAVARARVAIGKANQAHIAGAELIDKRSKAGTQLRNAVADIDMAVLKELSGMEGAIQAVPGIVAQLGQNTAIFANLAKSAPALPPPPDPRRKMTANAASQTGLVGVLAKSVSDLIAQGEQLDSSAQQLVGMIAALSANISTDRLKSCKVESVETTLSVTPQELTFTEKTEYTRKFIVQSGKEPYMAKFVQDSHAGLSFALLGDEIDVKAAADVTANPAGYQLLIRDASNQVVIVNVKVVANPASTNSTGAAARASRRRN